MLQLQCFNLKRSVDRYFLLLCVNSCLYLSVHWPKHIDFDKPENEGLQGARNFYINTDLKVEVGVWHILPHDLINEGQNKSQNWFDKSLSNGQTIILYLHGNTGSRAREHRIELYKVLQKLNYHIICFDYRGYADSSPMTPSKTGVVDDALRVYEHTKKLAKDVPIIVYGHSLGKSLGMILVLYDVIISAFGHAGTLSRWRCLSICHEFLKCI